MFHEMTIAGVKRQLPLFPVTDDLYIGAFIMFGDVEITVELCKLIFDKIKMLVEDYNYPKNYIFLKYMRLHLLADLR